MVVRQGLVLAAVGIAVGLAYVRHNPPALQPAVWRNATDPLTAAVTGLLAMVAAAASFCQPGERRE